ncbi:MAG: ATP-binding protein, partial [Planctomycetaceae bacterium]|nr:ATP-binding protein [Planctomycetaceae bacterium]
SQPFVIDNTNPTRQKRRKYILAAKKAGFSLSGFYFQSQIEACLNRNAERKTPEQVPEVAIFSIAKQLELPSYEEGFDHIFYVSLAEREFQVEEWNDEL